MNSKLTIWLIVFLAVISIWINLPSVMILPDKTKILGFPVDFRGIKTNKIEVKILGRDLNLSFLAPLNWTGRYPLHFGLDLQGGTELVLRADMRKINSADYDTALESARQVIERRVNFYGVSEATVQSAKVGNERRLIVELPGVNDLQTAVNLVGKTAQLEFREIEASPSAESSPSAFITYQNTKSTGLTGADLQKAQVVYGATAGNNTGPEVQIQFTPDGSKKFAEITKRNVGKPLPIFLDKLPIEAPVVSTEIVSGPAVISGSFTVEQAKNLAIQLNAGALPVPISILEQRSIGATLGAESVNKSIAAGVIGLTIVVVYMIAYYGLYGVVADLALLLYTLLTLTVFRTGLFLIPPVSLSLAGIAGFILSVGMAVDANILTFERMKEEVRSGLTGRLVLERGFSRAWTSIRDSNVSSLITASILYAFGTSVVRGFALTLAIGVLVSMFSAVVVTQTFLRFLPRFKR